MKAPLFFETLVSNHWKEFSKINPLEFENVCNTFNCNSNDSLNEVV
jgi:hypothetical protein